jgi:hypothetical protein
MTTSGLFSSMRRPGELADPEVAHGLDSSPQDLGRYADDQPIHQPLSQERGDHLRPSFDQHRADSPLVQRRQEGDQVYAPSGVGRQAQYGGAEGDLTEKDVEGIRGGSIADLPLSHVIALASTFGVEPSYLVNGYAEAALDRETVETLRDDTTRAIARESAHLPDRERRLVLGIVRQFEGACSPEGDDRGVPSGGR